MAQNQPSLVDFFKNMVEQFRYRALHDVHPNDEQVSYIAPLEILLEPGWAPVTESIPIADAVAMQIRIILTLLGYQDVIINTDTLDFWIKVMVKYGDRHMDWTIDITKLGCNGHLAFRKMALQIIGWLGNGD